jgi:hypothetical protein
MATYYFSGQGSFYVAERDSAGLPRNFVDLCNVSAMEISIDITKFEHKESKTGQRAIDLTIIQEKNGTFTMTMENVNTFNLALVMFGTKAVVPGAAVVAELVPIFTDGGRYVLDHMNLDSTVSPTIEVVEAVAASAWTMSTAYALGDTVTEASPKTPPRFWKATTAGTSSATEPTFPDGPVGTTTPDGGTLVWTDQGVITPVENTDIAFDYPHGSVTMTIGSLGGGNTLDIDYTHLGYSRVDALTDTSRVRWLRFEGLNTVDDEPVVVDIYKASLDPLSGYGVINEEIAQMEVTGNVLLDDLRSVGDQFFRQRQAADVDNSGTNPEQ